MGIVVRQSIKGTIASYFGVAIGFITTFFILTRLLTAEEIGLTRVFIEAATLFAGLAQLGTNASVMRFYPHFKDEESKDHGFFFWSIAVPFIGFVIFAILYLIFRIPIENLFSEKSPLFIDYYYLVIPMALCMLYTAVFEVNSNVLQRIVIPRFIREVGIRVLLLGVYLLYGFKIISIDGLMVGLCGTYAIATLLNIWYLLKLKRVSFKPDFRFISKSLKREYILYTLFLVVSALGSAITPSINTFFVSAKLGLRATGVLTIATFVASVIEIPYRSLGSITQPLLAQAMKERNIDEANNLTKKVSLHQFIVGAFIFLIIWMNIDLFFELLPNGEQYSVAKTVVLFLSLSRLINSTFNISTSALSYSKHYYFSLPLYFILTAVSIVLNNKLIPIWGIDGAAIATLVAYVVYYILLLIISYFTTKTTPFSKRLLISIILICILFYVNSLWIKFITPNIMSLEINHLLLSFIEGILRSGIIVSLGVVIIYKSKISAEINGVIDRVIKILK